MTRFFLTLSDAIHLLFQTIEHSVGGETYVMNMPSFRISDLAEIIANHYGNNMTSIEEVGIRSGEKIHEELISEHESKNSYVFNENYFVILPSIKINKDYSHVDKSTKVNFKTFSSADCLKNKDHLEKLLFRGGFLIKK